VTVTLAGLLAVLGIVAVLAYVQKANIRAVDGMKAVTVLVAKAPIPSGTRASQALSEKLLTVEKLPSRSVPADAVHKISTDLSSLVTSSAIQPGQLLLRELLVPVRQVTGAIAIPPGKVALSVLMCLQEDVAGYVKPGSHIAVFDTYESGGGSQSLVRTCDVSHGVQDKDKVFTRLLLADVEVLSVTTAPPATGTAASNGAVLTGGTTSAASQGAVYVTVAASQKQAEQLILAAQTGMPYLALTTQDSGITRDFAPTQLFK